MTKQIITVDSGFQYSVNIKYDVSNPGKIKSYVPTESFIGLTRDILLSVEDFNTDRARLVIGPYGTGKSHLITVIASLLRKSIKEEDYQPLIAKLNKSGYGSFAPDLDRFFEMEPFLTVILNPSDSDLNGIFLNGLQEGLSSIGMNDLMPKTISEEIIKTIKMWNGKFPNTYNAFKSYLESDYGLREKDFLEKVNLHNKDAIAAFLHIFPLVTAGTEFNIYNTKNIPELYQEVASVLKDRGYKGIYVIVDEFNKILESSAHANGVVNLKLLQDFAEMCSRSEDKQVHLMLISHQHMSQYATSFSQEILDNWRKVEGRFSTIDIRQSDSKTYQLISRVIEKDMALWTNYVQNFADEFEELEQITIKSGLFNELEKKELRKWVIEGCYPLHPTTVFALPRISNRLAQNERTLFTFLATRDFHTLGSFLMDYDQTSFETLTMDVLFDYFSVLAQKNRNYDSFGRYFMLAREAFVKLGADASDRMKQIIKTLAIIMGLGEPALIPTKNNLKFCLVGNDFGVSQFDECFTELVDNKIIYERRSDGRIHFLEGSDIDFPAEIDKILGDYRYANLFDVCDILNDSFTSYPIIANRYNDEFEMTRFFYQEYFSVEEVLCGIDWKGYLRDKNYADGVVAHLVCQTEEQIQDVKSYIAKEGYGHGQVIYVIPTTPINNLSSLTHKYRALKLLKKDKRFLETDPNTLFELEAYLEDYENQIEIAIAPLINHRSKDSAIFYKGKKQESVYSKAELSRLVSEVCKDVFSDTPKINNELINRSNVSRTVINARKKVISALLDDITEPQLGLTGHGPDVSIFRSLLRRPSIYREQGGVAQIGLFEETNPMFLNVIVSIHEEISKSSSKPLSFDVLFDKLRSEPFGLRLGVMPVILATAFKTLGKSILIQNQASVEQALDAELLEDITKNTHNFTVTLVRIDQVKSEYLHRLGGLFEPFMAKEIKAYNAAYPIGTAMKRWFIDLPKYTRESRSYSEQTKRFRRILNMPLTDSTELLFKSIPKIITGSGDFKASESDIYIENIRKIKLELESHLIATRSHLERNIIQAFGGNGINDSLSQVLKDWYSGLKEDTKVYAFSGIPFEILNMARDIPEKSDDSLDKVISIIVGLNLVDWSDNTREKFEKDLEAAIETISSIELESISGVHHKVYFFNSTGKVIEKRYAEVEIGPLGQVLYSSLEDSLDGFADAIDLEEKRKILLELLKSIS